MKIDYDTEFIDDGETIELISIGMVREDGKEYYAVVHDMGVMVRAAKNDWLRKNVLRYLPVKITDGLVSWDTFHPDWKHVKPREQIAKEVREFCTEKGIPELWAWYAAYDHVVLSQLFGRMLDLPEDMPMWTNDLRQELHRLGNPAYPAQLEGDHNALHDARWNYIMRTYLAGLDR
jgi:hypothetical protein